MLIGLLLIISALSLTIYNIWDEKRAGTVSRDVFTHLSEIISSNIINSDTNESSQIIGTEEKIPDYILNPNVEMPTIQINNNSYIGIIEIPYLNLKLPVMSEWSYPLLKIAPCRYKGSAYLDNMIIAGHNYSTHFGNLSNLKSGSKIIFTDADGNTFKYISVETEVLDKSASEEMESGDWDLSLFTCTVSGESRVTVRCKKSN